MDGGHNAHTKAEQAPCHLSKLHKDSYCQEEQWVDRYCSEVWDFSSCQEGKCGFTGIVEKYETSVKNKLCKGLFAWTVCDCGVCQKMNLRGCLPGQSVTVECVRKWSSKPDMQICILVKIAFITCFLKLGHIITEELHTCTVMAWECNSSRILLNPSKSFATQDDGALS